MPFLKAEMRIWGVNFRSPAALNKAATALNKAATTALNKDKAVRVHKVPVCAAAFRDRNRKNRAIWSHP